MHIMKYLPFCKPDESFEIHGIIGANKFAVAAVLIPVLLW